jgi:hopene-associated glycosyltransferase HpnB
MTEITAAAVLAVVAWVYLLAAHGQFWRTDQRLPPLDPGRLAHSGSARRGQALAGSADWPSVVAVVPARDEAAVLPQALPTLLGQDYPGSFTVIVVDDDSADGTAEIARRLAGQAPGQAAGEADNGRLRVIAARPVPDGWAGKVWAMSEGVRAAGQPGYLLFTDADIAYAPGTITALVRAAAGSGRAIVSQMALLRAETAAERLLIPAFVYFFAKLYPFRRVNNPRSRTAAAAGGCMLVRRTALEQAGGLEPIRAARIDDVALGRLLKRASAPGGCWLGFSTDVVSKRPYTAFGEIWDMVARSAYTQLRYSPLALVGVVLGLTFLYLLPVAATVAGLTALPGAAGPTATADGWLAVAGLAAWVIMSVSYLPALRLTGLSPLRAPTLPLAAALYAAMTVSSAWRHHAGRGGEWKGRTIPARPAS